MSEQLTKNNADKIDDKNKFLHTFVCYANMRKMCIPPLASNQMLSNKHRKANEKEAQPIICCMQIFGRVNF